MTAKEIAHQLEKIAAAGEFEFESESAALTEAWAAAGVGEECIEPILQFMEAHPSIEYGSPGALVHFMERFYRKGYDEQLVQSLTRKPTVHTVWMLNRVINGETGDEWERLVEVMRQATENPAGNTEARNKAIHFLKRLEA